MKTLYGPQMIPRWTGPVLSCGCVTLTLNSIRYETASTWRIYRDFVRFKSTYFYHFHSFTSRNGQFKLSLMLCLFVRYFETRLINWDNMNSCLRARRYPEAMWKQINSFSASRIVSSNRVRGIDNHPHVDRRGNGEQAWEEDYHFSFVDLLRCINITSPEIFAREIGAAGCNVIHWCMLDVWSLGSLDGP